MHVLDPAIAWLAALGAGTIFLASAVIKLRDLTAFAGAVANYHLVPEVLVTPISCAVPLAELGAATAIIVPRWRVAGALALLVMLAVFSLAIVVNLARGRYNVDCGCFGSALRQHLSWWLVARNLGLMMLVGLALISPSRRALTALDGCTVGFGLVTLLMLYAGINYVLANRPRLRELGARYA